MTLPTNVELRIRFLYDDALLDFSPFLRKDLSHTSSHPSVIIESKKKVAHQFIKENPFIPLEQIPFIQEDNIFTCKSLDRLGPIGESLNFLSQTYLTFQNGQPVCRFEKLAEFTDVRLQVFVDQIACWAVAYRMASDHCGFSSAIPCSWPVGLGYDHTHLSESLDTGLVDGHVHLGGVPTTIDLWHEIINPRSHLLNFMALRKWKPEYDGHPFSEAFLMRLRQARLLRDTLWALLNDQQDCRSKSFLCFANPKSESSLKSSVFYQSIQSYLDYEDAVLLDQNARPRVNVPLSQRTKLLSLVSSGGELPRRLPNGRKLKYDPDRPENMPIEERRLLIYAFCAALGMFKSIHPWFFRVLGQYLTIQNLFHRAVTQSMRRPGFSNFVAWYDSKARKLFSSSDPNRQRMILNRVTDNGNTRVEGRITPEYHTIRSWLNAFRIYQRQNPKLDFQLGRDWGLIVHFIKEEARKKSKTKKDRNVRFDQRQLHRRAFRSRLKTLGFRLEDHRRGDIEIEQAVLAIDAARHEKDASPELFAPVFRYLRRPFTDARQTLFSIESHGYRIHPLRATFHVGEFFNHPISGLRAIDESLRYLDLRSGDRIGHGTVLGIDYPTWIRNTGTNPYLNRAELLDNLVWMADRLEGRPEYRELITPVLSKIAREFEILYRSEPVPNPRTLIELLSGAWKIRWMDPVELFDVLETFNFRDGWFLWPDYAGNRTVDQAMQGVFIPCHKYANCAIDHNPKRCSHSDTRNWKRCRAIRSLKLTSRAIEWRTATIDLDPIFSGEVSKASIRYLWIYHHDPSYRKRSVDAIVCPDDLANWPALFDVLRDMILADIESRDITIECCPTSNYLIGAFGSFDSHPVFSFDTTGLNAQTKHRVRVMINTDNPGIFATSLENEYALLASAAISRGENPSRVLNWITHLKNQSAASRFLRKPYHEPLDPIRILCPELLDYPLSQQNSKCYAFLKKQASRERLRTHHRIRDSMGLNHREGPSRDGTI